MYAILIILHFMFMLFLQSTVCHSTSTSSSTTSGCSTWTRTRSTTATCATKWRTKFYTTPLQTPQLLQATQSQLPSVNVTQPEVQRVQNVQQNVATSSVLNPGKVPLSALAASGVSGAQANFPVPQQGHIQMTASGDQTHLNYFQEAIAEQAAAELLHKETKPEDPMMPIFHNSHFLAWITLAPVFHLLQAAAPLDLLVVTVQYQE